MKIKKHKKSKAIEKEMNFEFDKLELIGYLEMCFDILVYKYKQNIFLFEIDDNEILSITKVQNDGKYYGWLTVKGKDIPYRYFEKIKVLYTNPAGTYINCLISFDQKQTWKTFNGTNWNIISDTTPNNILLNGMDISKVNELDKNKLIAGGFTGDIDFRIAMKTNDNTVTPSITKIYILYC